MDAYTILGIVIICLVILAWIFGRQKFWVVCLGVFIGGAIIVGKTTIRRTFSSYIQQGSVQQTRPLLPTITVRPLDLPR